MRTIRITEAQFKRILSESVYINRNTRNDKKKTFDLSYNKNGDRYSRGNYSSQDMLKTDKMDNGLGNDTYEVPLKGGITSYNITSINGSAVMHYFKNYFDHEKTEVDVKDGNRNVEKYSLVMKNEEFRQFLDQFTKKVNSVIEYRIKDFSNINAISIYPVPSSHRFNECMAEIMAKYNLANFPCQVINQNIFVKDLRNLQRDEEFIKKNQEFYSSAFSSTDSTSTGKILNTSINRALVMQNKLKPYIAKMNEYAYLILNAYQNFKVSNSEKTLKTIVSRYKMYYDLWAECQNIAVYGNEKTGGMSSISSTSIAEPIKYSKGPSIEGRSEKLWQLVKPFFRKKVSRITNAPYTAMPIQTWQFHDFEIKALSNGERMGMKNIYNPNTDTELVQQELEKIKGTVFVIFDDNISGGATLSDICYQCKELGITNIIPITFGQMAEKWQMGHMMLNKPVNDQGEVGKFNL